MNLRIGRHSFFLLLLLILPVFQTFSQCLEIEKILVDACDDSGDEGFNEMTVFSIGPTPINTATANINWPSQAWQGFAQNGFTASKVAALNTQIAALGGCGRLLEPSAGLIPPFSKVILITSQNFSLTANVFGALTSDVYILFQNNPTTTGGHFGNYNATPGIRTLTINFGGCSDTVSYDRSLLVDANGLPGASNGATVNFSPAGVASYTNGGCVAPIDVFTVEAGTPLSACPGGTITLAGTAQGQASVLWTAGSGVFSNSATLNPTFTLPFSASGSVVLTLTATNSCGNSISDTVTITVNPATLPLFSPVATICAGDPLTALPLMSSNGISGTWLPALDNTQTTTYNFTPNAGQCASGTSMVINVNQPQIPTFSPIAPICIGTIVSPLPTVSLEGITGSWLPAFDNTQPLNYTFTPSAGQCATTNNLTLTVTSGVLPTFNPVATICSGDALLPLPLVSLNGITGSWLPPLDNTQTLTYTFTPNPGQCATTTTLTITVNTLGTVPTFNPVSPICVGDTLLPLPTTSLNGITGSWLPPLDNTQSTTYTFTPDTGQCAVNITLRISVSAASVVPTFSSNTITICSGDTLLPLPTTSLNGITGSWSPALDNTQGRTYTFTPNTGQCALTASYLINVNTKVTPMFNSVNPICAGDILTPLPTTSLNGITGSWSPAIDNTQTKTYTFTPTAGLCANSTTLVISVSTGVTPTFNAVSPICVGGILNPLPTTSLNGITGSWTPPLDNTQTKIYTFTPNAGQCASTQLLTITVNLNVLPVFNPVVPICSGTTLAALPTTSLNGITGSWLPALDNTQTKTYTFTPTAGQCATQQFLTITVDQKVTPTFNSVSPICSGTVLTTLPTVSNNGITGSWSPALNNTQTTTYTFTPNIGQCANTTRLTITVIQKTTPDFPTTLSVCSGGNVPVLASVSPNGVSGTWSPVTISNSVSGTYVFTPSTGICANTASLRVTIDANPEYQEQGFICFDAGGLLVKPATIDTGLSSADYNFIWTLDGNPLTITAAVIQATQIGTYKVIATNNTTNCTITTITSVSATPPATAAAYVNEDFSEVQQIIVKVTGGSGNFLYQLNNGPFQSTPVFYITQGGDYDVYVKDVSGCSSFALQVTALNFPKFFTPNTDGYNDLWNVEGLQPSQEGVVSIFDRYGKLLKQISANGIGWDGIYNGNPVPSADYWFMISYRNAMGQSKTFRSHFSLKR